MDYLFIEQCNRDTTYIQVYEADSILEALVLWIQDSYPELTKEDWEDWEEAVHAASDTVEAYELTGKKRKVGKKVELPVKQVEDNFDLYFKY